MTHRKKTKAPLPPGESPDFRRGGYPLLDAVDSNAIFRAAAPEHFAHPEPRWRADNLRGVPSEWVRDIGQATHVAIAQYGLDPCTRAQAAAHEAGHVIVAHVLGNTVDDARLTRRTEFGRVVWIGGNRYTSPRGSGVTTARENPALVFQCAMLNLAGFVGEGEAGLAHPASSIDERVKAQKMAEGVAIVFEVPADEMLARVFECCAGALKRNRNAFDAIRRHLFRARRLTRAEASRMLARVEVEGLL